MGQVYGTSLPHSDGTRRHSLPSFSYLSGPKHRSKLFKRSVIVFVAISLLGVATAAQQVTQDTSSSNSNNATQLQPADENVSPGVTEVSAESNVDPSTTSTSAGSSVSSTSTVSTGGGSSVSVKVNGQEIPVPENGSSHQVITTPNGNTSVSVSSSQSSSGTSYNSSVTTTNSNVFQTNSNVSNSTTVEMHSGAP